ncbi:fumarylacetoacetate hydrolase family protein [Allonocardiopsis opalescens]|uniref:2-keto-4-pentenoate hydratase/2-oxohepta-3-ene-1,7-dioic acid hydratase in catechol pathway n=1 Tax=Allonocardiopsis opalescens TaxID=1144618 RepID=A0A2T0QEC4_9ACTN|nr:fumarylacetoacetate hydrolase family protein [Allonocardiopsis opalescens]PRY02268.1 2-keto-4-pentenoate hydratase/2-oxohepta-3-ene-1,7-dioic acid hydratase in catechol pathway [Allonocardiopsis opalescens]
MKLVRYRYGGREAVGVLDAERAVVRAVDGAGGQAPELVDLIRDWSALPAGGPPTGAELPLDELTLLAPLPRPARNIFCVGKNYHDHSEEFAGSGFDSSDGKGAPAVPSLPIFFTKVAGSVIGPGDPIEPHTGVTAALDYEVELAVIIGTGGRGITEADSWNHIWGYTIVNDITARDLQRDHKQWFLGKSLDTFCPMGPWAVSADEVKATELTVETHVNGERRQHANTRDLIFGIPELIATLSAGITLEPGDIIATGTPAGVGLGFDPPRFLGSGDEVSVSISGLGTLSNPVGPATG